MDGTIQEITLDMIGKTKEYPVLRAKQFDTNSRYAKINLAMGNKSWSLPFDCQVYIYVEKYDGKVVFNECQISDMVTVLAPLTKQMLAVHGEAKCELYIVASDGDIKSQTFLLQVEKAIMSSDAVESADEFGALGGKLAEIQEAVENAMTAAADLDTLRQDFAQRIENGELTGPQGEQGLQGEQGPRGEPGSQGEQGPAVPLIADTDTVIPGVGALDAVVGNWLKAEVEELRSSGNADNLLSIGRELTEFTWEELSEIAKAGTSKENNIHVGDFKPLTITITTKEGTVVETLRMQVAGIDTYASCGIKSVFPGHHIDWISIELYSPTKTAWNYKRNYTYTVPFPESVLCESLTALSEGIPMGIASLMVEKSTYTEEKNGRSQELSSTAASLRNTGILWIPSEFEVTGTTSYGHQRWASVGQMQYPLFSNSGIYNRMKQTVDGLGQWWWTMTITDNSETDAVCILEDGTAGTADVGSDLHVPICFRL